MMSVTDKEIIEAIGACGAEIWIEQPQDDELVMITFGTLRKVINGLIAETNHD
jgi:hypothetical protein